ncbi:MAG: outer membrane beta-barrel protein, partial [Alistipes sp.]|nr:outer membrane beta-barrel protein [Alistipes sp.]
FFGEDVSTALNSLPAQAVKSVEVVNKLSDNAEFSGMDDGEGYKALNIVTHENMRQGVFGKLYGGYGYQEDTDDITSSHKYNFGGNVNYFSGSSRLSAIGLLNNINQQNFSFEDIMGVTGSTGGMGGGMGRGVGQYMVRPQSGVANVGSMGLNYSNSWGKKEAFKLQASYFFNKTHTKNLSELIRWYEAPLADQGTLTESGESDNTNSNHRLNLRLDWRISENHSIMSRTNVSFQGYDPWSHTTGLQEGEKIYDIIDRGSEGGGNGLRFSEFVQYRVKLGKTGRLLTVDGRISTRNFDYDSRSFSVQQTTDVIRDEQGVVIGATPIMRYLESLSDSKNMGAGGSITYAEPISKSSQITLRYNVNYSGQKSDKSTWNFGQNSNYEGGQKDENLSSYQTSDYVTHSAGPGFRYSKDRNTVIVNVNYQYSTLKGMIDSAKDQDIKHSYNDVTYFMMGNFNINRQNSIRMFVSSYTENPGIWQLQNILDISNAQNVWRGNEKLNPAYSHRINFHYNYTNLEKGRTFMWMFSFNATQDYMASSLYTSEDKTGTMKQIADELGYTPLRYSTYENVDGRINLRTHFNLGIPLNFMKCNFNIMAGINYSKTPSLVNGEKNIASNMGYDARAVLSSNISENIDFTFSWNGTYNQADNSLAAGGGKNEYFNHTATGALKAVFWKGFTFTASANYVQYIGFTNDYNDSYTLCNAYLGKKLFRNQLGEIMVGVNDIFNQNTAFSRTTGSGYTQNAWNSVIGRYFTVQFTYNLRVFGKKGSKNLADYGIMEGGKRSGGMMGPPMGGRH